MPELPEVETVVRSLAPVVGSRIVNAEFRQTRVLRGAGPGQLAGLLAGRRLLSIERYGKFIVITLEGGGFLLVHLGMTGRLLLGGEPGKHTHAILTFENQTLLFDDPRQFGRFEYSAAFPERVARLGPEPFDIPEAQFAATLRRRKTSIKALLLNQDFVRGIGNIYADEALFRAGLDPRAQASRISAVRAHRLLAAIREVLAEAIAAGGSSISDYVDAGGRKGFFQLQHNVYQRTDEACVTCGTAIRRIQVAQRSSHFCPKCQKR
jgi:formamidopyrimidine-DNA glycosylase